MNPQTGKKWPAQMAQLYDALYLVVCKYVADEGDAHQAACEALSALLASPMAGTQVYVPKADVLERAARDRQIYMEFNGRNVQQLAHQHKLTERQIYTIVQTQGQLYISERQTSLLS